VSYQYTKPPSLEQAQQSPLWLSNLYVAESQRNVGCGEQLIDAAKAYSQAQGYRELWLSAAQYTAYYQKRGWQHVRETRLGGRDVNILRIDL
jgi:N-acetylglutamate synthase-like GNAT family acetyltransferase